MVVYHQSKKSCLLGIHLQSSFEKCKSVEPESYTLPACLEFSLSVIKGLL